MPPGVSAADGDGPARSGSPELTASRPVSSKADATGRPHQKPSPTKIATSTGASAVPRPSSALSTSTDESTRSGWNAAVNVFSAGTVRPKPTPTNAVATSSSGNATDVSDSKNWLIT